MNYKFTTTTHSIYISDLTFFTALQLVNKADDLQPTLHKFSWLTSQEGELELKLQQMQSKEKYIPINGNYGMNDYIHKANTLQRQLLSGNYLAKLPAYFPTTSEALERISTDLNCITKSYHTLVSFRNTVLSSKFSQLQVNIVKNVSYETVDACSYFVNCDWSHNGAFLQFTANISMSHVLNTWMHIWLLTAEPCAIHFNFTVAITCHHAVLH